MLSQELVAQVRAWMAQDLDRATANQLNELLVSAESGDADAQAEIADMFSARLAFGTAGLRAALGPGPNRMNRVVVSQTAAGIAQWLKSQGITEGKILIGYDARHNSDVFAKDSAEILAGAGFTPLLTEDRTPTPVVAFGIRHFGCIAGIVVTASHNPPQDDGYKVYLGDGRQIVSPADKEISAAIDAVATQPLADLPRSTNYLSVHNDLDQPYIDAVTGLVDPAAAKEITWVYTAMHGVGARIVDRVVNAAGFPAGVPVLEQLAPDPDFPTVAFPNPEAPGAIDLALDLARKVNADIVVANDPDADRCAAAAPFVQPDGSVQWRMLTGDELGVLLGDDFLNRGVTGTYANSIVSSTLLGKLAEAAGQRHEVTLTGFKWISRAENIVFGYEEAIGYCCDPAHVLDKDGISALVMILQLAASLKAQGKTVQDQLDDIYRRHGVHHTSQLSVRVEDRSIISDAMAKLRATPPTELIGEPVEVRDLRDGVDGLPPTDGIEITGDHLHVVARPSGTEPKLKCYLETRVSAEEATQDIAEAKAKAAQMCQALRCDMATALGI